MCFPPHHAKGRAASYQGLKHNFGELAGYLCLPECGAERVASVQGAKLASFISHSERTGGVPLMSYSAPPEMTPVP